MKKIIITIILFLITSTASASKSGVEETILTYKLNREAIFLMTRPTISCGHFDMGTATGRGKAEGIIPVIEGLPGFERYSCLTNSGVIFKDEYAVYLSRGVIQKLTYSVNDILFIFYNPNDIYFSTTKISFKDRYYIDYKFNLQTGEFVVTDFSLPFLINNSFLLPDNKTIKINDISKLNSYIHDYYFEAEKKYRVPGDKNESSTSLTIMNFLRLLLISKEIQNEFIGYVQLGSLPNSTKEGVIKKRKEDAERARYEELQRKYGR